MGRETVVDEPKTDTLRRDIARTQHEMSETIDEIHHRLSPRYIMNQTKEKVRRTGVSTSQTFITKVKENPIPAAMVGIGLWLLTRSSDQSDDGGLREVSERNFATARLEEEPSAADRARRKASYAVDTAREKAAHLAESTRDTVTDVADAAKGKAAELADSTRERTSYVADAARRKAHAAQQQTRDLLRDSPLVAGLAAIALGAIVAAVIPETDKENELLGETRDRLLDQTKDLAREGLDKAKRVAAVATDTVKQQVRSASTDTATGTPQFR